MTLCCQQRLEPGCHDESVTVENMAELSAVSQLLKVSRVKRLKVCIALHGNYFVCYMRSQCYLLPNSSECTPVSLNVSQSGQYSIYFNLVQFSNSILYPQSLITLMRSTSV